MNPKQHYAPLRSANICYFEWGEPNNQPTLLLVHATGFHARCWDQVVKLLDGYHVIAVDQRNHGRSQKTGPVDWSRYGKDLVELIDFLQLPEIRLVGHSMGGYCAAYAMTQIQTGIVDAVLVDPVIFDPSTYQAISHHEAFLDESNQHPIARRRNQFVDADAMFENFHGRGSYAAWTDEALRDYCNFGLEPDQEQGGFKLACPPALEASIYMSSHNSSICDELDQVNVPVTVLRAEQRVEGETELDFTKSPTWPELGNQFTNGRDVHLPELTHFMPMQAPELVAAYILNRR